MLADPQIAANRLVHEIDQPGLGRLRQARPAARFEKTPASLPRPAPALGEHTLEILGEVGYRSAEIGDLRRAGVVSIT
jgi:crotonobetainyl-CoA:carnitine CoA-transferase CaiB-like acyl-CoA transferase